MIQSIKNKIWEFLKEKEISLAMIFDREGEILWHQGRPIGGRNVQEGMGFSKTFILKALSGARYVHTSNIIVDSLRDQISDSSMCLHIKSLIIQPLNESLFLYLDSGRKNYFNETDQQVFRILGELLSDIIDHIRHNESGMGGITGGSVKAKKMREMILKYSLEDEPVLLIGETGVGKSHAAELIHRYSGRKGKFFTVNTPCIPAHLFESEIFGYRKGAFTDARTDKKGYVDEARQGTLFFDEIAEVPLTFQAKLLRFIETKKYFPLGDATESEADVRIIAATNRDLRQAIERKEFREDLYFRLQILEIEIPPLRSRREDIQDLVMEKTYLLKGKTIGEGFWNTLQEHEWPGNVRELITVMTRAGIHGGDVLTGDEIQTVIDQTQFSRTAAPEEITDRLWQRIQEGNDFWDSIWEPFIGRDIDRHTVREVLKIALDTAKGNFRRLVRVLHLPEKDYHVFMTLMYKYKIDPRLPKEK